MVPQQIFNVHKTLHYGMWHLEPLSCEISLCIGRPIRHNTLKWLRQGLSIFYPIMKTTHLISCWNRRISSFKKCSMAVVLLWHHLQKKVLKKGDSCIRLRPLILLYWCITLSIKDYGFYSHFLYKLAILNILLIYIYIYFLTKSINVPHNGQIDEKQWNSSSSSFTWKLQNYNKNQTSISFRLNCLFPSQCLT